MTSYKGMNLVSIKRSIGRDQDPKERIRNRFGAGIDLQVALVDDPTTTKPLRQYVDGKRVEVQKPIKPWWFEQDNITYIVARYGAKKVALDNTNEYIAICEGSATKVQLKDVFKKLKQLALSGDLDDVLLKYGTKQK